MIDVIQKLIEPVKRRVMLLAGRAIISAVDDSNFLKIVQLQLLSGETRDNIPVIQSYGFTAVPLPGAEAFAIFPGGNRNSGIVVGTEDRRYRIKNLAGGEVALYDNQGNQVYLKQDGSVNVIGANKVTVTAPEVDVNATSKVVITSPTVQLSGNLSVGGNVSAGGSVAATGAVTAASATVTGAVAAGSVAATGAVAGATVAAAGVSLASVKTAYDGHTHVAPSGGGTTGGPNTSI